MISLDENGENWDFFGAFIREESGRVYYRELYQAEGLIYDFNLHLGDTVWVENSRALEGIHLVLTEIDLIPSETGFAEKWTLNCLEYPDNSETWIRGVGSMAGVMNSGIDIFGGMCGLHVLLCTDIDEMLYFQNPEYGSCYLLTTSLDLPSDEDFKVYYGSGFLTIDGLSQEKHNITVTDIEGRILASYSGSNERATIQIHTPTGIVLVTVISANNRTIKKVFIH